MAAARLADLAVIIRSKNAGPYRLTFDVLLPDAATFKRVKASGVLGRESVAKALSLKPSEVTSLFELESAHAFKVTIRRQVGQSDIGESDTYGCQQHVPLMELLVA
ncbi:MAG: DUF4387 domain-containing protein [Alphaproteobacteria bacterium]